MRQLLLQISQAYRHITQLLILQKHQTFLQEQINGHLPLAVKIDPSGDTVITLDTVTNFDDTVGNFDSPTGDFDLGGTDTTSNPNFNNKNRDAKGFYNFEIQSHYLKYMMAMLNKTYYY